MKVSEVRKKYLGFFAKRKHVIIPSSAIVPENDPTTLFTGSGMQPLLPYLLGKDHPQGTRVVDSQKCFRAMDIDEVGDNRHTTFFEMLGNWSFGDYFKEDQITWMSEFLFDEIGIDPSKLYVTVFIGDEQNGLPRDTESSEFWRKIFSTRGIEAKLVDMGTEEKGSSVGMQSGRIFYYGAKNWWSRAGGPEKMPIGEPGGPDSEMFYDFETPHDSKFGKECHPNCDCGRFMEIGNNVFMMYKKVAEGRFDLLPRKNIDFGGGLERITAAANNEPDIFKIDLLNNIIYEIERLSKKTYVTNMRLMRVVADHMRAVCFLISDGVVPSNTERGYVLRRLLRRAIRYADNLGLHNNDLSTFITPVVVALYQDIFGSESSLIADKIRVTIVEEENNFRSALDRGLKELRKMAWGIYQKSVGPTVVETAGLEITGKNLFYIYSTYGFPFELSVEEINNNRIAIQSSYAFEVLTEDRIKLLKQEYDLEATKHQELSRAGAEQKFKGGLADHSEQTVRYHTAHHMLLAALQKVLGKDVHQRGSNITPERLRIDFAYGIKMTDEQKAEVTRIVNEKIFEELPVTHSIMKKENAEKIGAEHEFNANYPDAVSVYSVGPKSATQDDPKFSEAFSIEFCGGPHVHNTRELGADGKHFKILKEEAVAAGIRRIKAVLV